MKKLVAFAATFGLYSNLWAAGLITFANLSTQLVVTNNGITTGPAALSSGFEVQIFYQPFSNPTPAPISFSSGIGNIGSWEPMLGSPVTGLAPLPGRFNAGTETTGADVAAGGMVWFQVVAWDGGFGSLAAAETSGTADFGESIIWAQATGAGPPNVPAQITGPNEFTGVIINTPEPSAIALSGIGATFWLLFRRRK